MPEIAADVRGTEKLQTYRVRPEKKKKSLKSLLFYQNDTLPIYDGNFFVGVWHKVVTLKLIIQATAKTGEKKCVESQVTYMEDWQ